jgi:ribosomal protein S18 acetylase RimI-like enzyme
VTRTRSEYRLSPISVSSPAVSLETVHPSEVHREALAALMLDAYRGTIDDEGEDLDDAQDVIDQYLASVLRPHSFVVIDNDVPVAFAFALVVGDMHYIDPVVVASARKRHGVGSAVVRVCLRSLSDAGVAEVGATITDGNTASERLFAALGFTRHGPWP